ncbi:Histidine protein methyltransferase 1 [Lamellibrachia satsuma]|nr:Histidine protein methyltransferase 1 [Lamellibrachia satsuma]
MQDEAHSCNDVKQCQKTPEPTDDKVLDVEARELFIQPKFETADSEYKYLEVSDGSVGLLIKHVTGHQAETQLQQSVLPSGDKPNIIGALENNLDVLPNVYEGGLKIWECSVDLTHYLFTLPRSHLAGKKVLELGCGAGLPGIAAYLRGASHVHFQDYNEEVLKLVTYHNVRLNSPHSSDVTQKCRFFSGDWASVDQVLQRDIAGEDGNRYDIILTSETIYSTDSHLKLHQTMRELLKSTGVVYLAAKTYYFGVGGGTRSFEDLVRREGVFSSTVVQEFAEGVQREILQLRFKEGGMR